MSERKPISNKLRFEVFKRDKFTCQYCGKKAPDVVLNIDHIKPVADGGDNDILNLVTSCFECNNGKRDIKLDDNSTVEKQRRQLELIQDRREQLEMMLEWKNSLASFESYEIDAVVDYLKGCIQPVPVTMEYRNTLASLIKRYSVTAVLDQIDESRELVKYDGDIIDKDSVNLFLDKVPKILAYKNKPIIDQKVAYILGICKNRLSQWNHRRGAKALNSFIDTLKSIGLDTPQICNYLDSIKEYTIKCGNNPREWRNHIISESQRIAQEYGENGEMVKRMHLDDHLIDAYTTGRFVESFPPLEITCYLLRKNPEYSIELENKWRVSYWTAMIESLSRQEDILCQDDFQKYTIEELKDEFGFVINAVPESVISDFFRYDPEQLEGADLDISFIIEDVVIDILKSQATHVGVISNNWDKESIQAVIATLKEKYMNEIDSILS